MSNYTKATNFATKDTLPTGDANKIVKGTEIDNEFTSISGAIASKADIASPTFTGTPAAPTAAAATNTTQVATTAHVFAERTNTATLTNKTLTSPTINTPTISGGSISGITDLTVADGGTGVSTIPANAVVLGNGTSAIQTVAPSTTGNFLRSNGTTWVSEAVTLVSGTVTSIATGNGLSGGTITSTGTLVVACPGFNTVGSYCYVTWYGNGATVSAGGNYAAGGGVQQIASTSTGGDSQQNLSGTWKWMGGTTTYNPEYSSLGIFGAIACRVS